MENISAILYINLQRRNDRLEHITKEIAKVCSDETKVYRIDAVACEPGALGCTLSHQKALEFALEHPEWSHVLVLEDDFTFRDDVHVEDNIKRLVTHDASMDVALFAFGSAVLRPTANDSIFKVESSQTTAGYLVSQTYIPVLLANFAEASTDMALNGFRPASCVDMHWKCLQPIGNWYTMVPSLGYQYANYSDIDRRPVNYGC